MRIAVITRHAVSNYGSILQAYATQRVLEAMGHDVRIVDYVREDELPSNIDATLLRGKPTWSRSLPRRALYLLLRKPETLVASKLFAKEREHRLRLTRQYRSLDELLCDPPAADVYLTGSDQVWGALPCGERDLAYALAFAPVGERRISYAASFGERAFPDWDKDAFARELRQYSSLLVRDCASADLLTQWGLSATRVLDPTLLLDTDEWRRFAEPIRDERFVLVYQIHSDSRVGHYAARVAERRGLPLIRMSCSLHQAMRPGVFRFLPTLGQVVSFFDKAACVITDSFHATAFCVNLNTPFVSVPISGEEPVRIGDILWLVRLESRLLGEEDDIDLSEGPIDWASVNQIIASKRRNSMRILEAAIAGSGESLKNERRGKG